MTINPHHITADITRLRRLHRATIHGRPALLPEGAVTKLDEVEQRLLEAVRRDNTGTPAADGYPTGYLACGGEDAAQSRTEGAALADYRVDPDTDTGTWGHTEHDRHHDYTTAAARALRAAADAIGELMERLDAIDRLATLHRTDPSGHCNACTRWVEGTANDRLRAGYCAACYRAWDRAGRPDRVQFERTRVTTTKAS